MDVASCGCECLVGFMGVGGSLCWICGLGVFDL